MHELPKLLPFNTELSSASSSQSLGRKKMYLLIYFFVHTSLENETNHDLLKPSDII
jgi:hypothetical protein